VLVAVVLSLASDALLDLPFLPMFGVSGRMAMVGFLACLVPARRALRLQPTEALKQAG
jgi:ABC-type lipoprotein release transport system permease subunit